MIKPSKALSIAFIAIASALSISANAETTAHPYSALIRAQTPAVQGKTVLLDVPAIAERVNEVVVNVRSLSDSGENLGSGFIIDPKGLIATNFHLISNSEARRGSSQRGPDSKTTPKLVTSVTVTLHDDFSALDVLDDGNGMTPYEFHEDFARLGGSTAWLRGGCAAGSPGSPGSCSPPPASVS